VKDVIEESKASAGADRTSGRRGAVPCRQLTPIIEKAVLAAKGKVKLVKMNIDEHPAIPGQMGIQSIPAVIAFVNGQPADGFMGAVPEKPDHRVHQQAGPRACPMRASPISRKSWRRPKNRFKRRGDPATAASILCRGGWRRTPPISPLLQDWPNAMWRPAPSSRPSKRLPLVAGVENAATAAVRAVQASIDPRRGRPKAARARSPSWNRKSPQNPLDHQAALRSCGPRSNASGKRNEAHASVARDRQARPQMERGRRAKATGAILRGVGDRPMRPPSKGGKRLSTISVLIAT